MPQFTVLAQAAEARAVQWRGSGAGVNWKPNEGAQSWAYDCQADEIGYGGAGGGGKTDLALGLAMTKHLRSIFFRRTYVQVSAAQDRSHEILTGNRLARFNEQKRVWRIQGGQGVRQLRFGAMEYERDKENWRGHPYDLMAFDETQNFTKSQVQFLRAWNRTNTPGQQCTLLLTFNPPTTPEGQWLVDYFAPWIAPEHPNPAKPGELRWFITDGDGKDTEVSGPQPVEVSGRWVNPRSRTFFPAYVQDNPYYMSTGYFDTLMSLPEPLRSQMAFGDFTIGMESHQWQVLPTALVRAAMVRGREGIPLDALLSGVGSDIACGGTDRTAIARWYRLANGRARFGPMLAYPGRQTPDGETAAARIIEALGGVAVSPNVDIAGVGQGVRTALRLAGVAFSEVNFASASYAFDSSGQLRFANVRAEAYWRFREALERGEVDLPDDRELLAELCAARWSLTTEGIQLELKDNIVKRLGRSPDLADAVVLAWYQSPVAGYTGNPWGQR